MKRNAAWMVLTGVTLALVACSGNPMPGDNGYPYNATGTYETALEALGTVFTGPAELTTSTGGLVHGAVMLRGPEDVAGDFSGTIVGDTLTFESYYERGGGCMGLLSGHGTIAEGGGSVVGDAVVDDDCSGEPLDATFTMTRQTE